MCLLLMGVEPADGGTTSAAWVLRGRVVGVMGEPVEGARVSLSPDETVTDDHGAFELIFTAPLEGDRWVSVEKTGFALKAFPEVFRPGQITEVRYVLPRERIIEARVRGSRLLPPVPEPDRTPQVSHFSFNRTDIDRTPGALEDVARVVQSLPGVAADPDLLANFFVRGGAPDEVLFSIDGVPLSNPFHLGGFASIINPQLVESADFYAGGAPARYEPTLSGALEVHYPSVEATRFHLVADLSVQSAKLRADIPLGIDGLSAVVSFRRSYFELYFAALKAFKVFGQNVVAPDITEAFGRVIYRRGRHRTLATFIHASDGLDFVIKPGEEVLVNFAGGLTLANTAQVASLHHSIALEGDGVLSATAAFNHDTNFVNLASARRMTSRAQHLEALLRADAKFAPSEKRKSSFGVQYAWRQLRLTGSVTDTRAYAPWAQRPIIDDGTWPLPISPRRVQSLVSAYAEHTQQVLGPWSLEAGARGQYDLAALQFSGSARLASSYVVQPFHTVLKLSAAVAAQPVKSPLMLDPTFGNPSLTPQQSINLVAAVEQPLPFEALLRIEGWAKWWSSLVVNPDTAEALAARVAQGQPAFESRGTGRATGIDVMAVGRASRFAYTVGFGWQQARRVNPLANGARDYAVEWEQPLSLAASLNWSPNSTWLVTGRANWRSGRPYTPIVAFTSDEPNQRWVPVLGSTSSARYPFFFELSLRGEYRFKVGALSCAAYLEVLNVTNTTNVFSYVYNQGDFAQGVEPDRTAFNHLPIRPFLGVRAEY